MDIDVLIVMLLVLILALGIALWLKPVAVTQESSPVIVRNVYASDWERGRPWGWRYGRHWGQGPWWHHRMW